MTLESWLEVNADHPVNLEWTGDNWVQVRGTLDMSDDAKRALRTLSDFAVGSRGVDHFTLVRYTRLA